MTCRNLCERLDSKIIVGKSIYEEGKNIVDVVKFISYMMVHFVLAVVWDWGFHLLTTKVGTEKEMQSSTFMTNIEVDQIV
jgi:hypothetical protein